MYSPMVLRDKRVETWFLMSDPFPLLAVIIAYLFIVLKRGPAYMKNRPAYDLKNFIQFYNIGTIFGCSYVIYVLLTNGWMDEYSLFTYHPVDYSMNERAVNLLKICYFSFLMKFMELIETVLFVLRKKQNQVSALHVYHHASAMALTWMITKYTGGGLITFLFLINNIVHVLMYLYYLLSTLGPQWQKRLAPYKPLLTIIQMVQFCFMTVQCAVGMLSCEKAVFYVLLTIQPNVFINFYMFGKFFKNSYLSKKSKTK